VNLYLGGSWVLRDTFRFICDYAEVNRREILQSEKDFIMQRRKRGLTLHAC